jgi:hypothetical protein
LKLQNGTFPKYDNIRNYFFIRIVGGGVHIGCPRGNAAMYWPIVPIPGDCEDQMWLAGETEVLGENLPAPSCHTRARTRAAAVGSQRLTA